MNQTICERCLNCKHLTKTWESAAVCKLLYTPIEKLDKCILDYDAIKNIQPGSFEEFAFQADSKRLLQFIGKNRTLAIGDTVVVLNSIQNTCHRAVIGDFLTVTDSNGYEYRLTDGKHEYTAYSHNWYLSLFKLEKPTEEEDSSEKLYAVRVEETLARTYIVHGATSLKDAIENVQRAYDNGDIILECDDCSGHDISASKCFANGVVPADRDVSYYSHFQCQDNFHEG